MSTILLYSNTFDIDYDNSVIKVRRTLKLVPSISMDGKREYKYTEQTPKTKKSIRDIPLSKSMKSYLEEQKEIQNKNKIIAADSYIKTDYVFTDKIGNSINKNKPIRHLHSILDTLKIPKIKFHALRHTFATRLFEKNVPVKTVQELMGHTDIQTTMNIYTHVMDDEKEKAINILDSIL